MTHPYKLSLKSAILISVNIILGAGLFLNTVPLAQKAGALSPFIYIFVALCMVPLIMVMGELVKIVPGGTLFNFAQKGLSTNWGFIVGWSYFVAKLASCSVMIHLFTSMARQAIPQMALINHVLLDTMILSLFTMLNLMNMKTGNRIQMFFISMKTMPIAFIILTGLAKFNLINFAKSTIPFETIPLAIPLAIYAFTGFESIVALSSHIEDPEKNAPTAIFGSFGIAIIITFLLQGSFFSIINLESLANLQSFNGITAFVQAALPSNMQLENIYAIFQLAVGISALGGAYGILFSNNWNLYALAEANTLPLSNQLKKKSQYNIATLCIVIQSIICLLYLTMAGSQQVMLQQINALGCTVAYTISTLAFINLTGIQNKKTLGYLALITCIFFIGTCIWGFINNGIYGLIGFSTLVAVGIVMHMIHTKTRLS
jgi:amino acid transporter